MTNVIIISNELNIVTMNEELMYTNSLFVKDVASKEDALKILKRILKNSIQISLGKVHYYDELSTGEKVLLESYDAFEIKASENINIAINANSYSVVRKFIRKFVLDNKSLTKGGHEKENINWLLKKLNNEIKLCVKNKCNIIYKHKAIDLWLEM